MAELTFWTWVGSVYLYILHLCFKSPKLFVQPLFVLRVATSLQGWEESICDPVRHEYS